jgi:CheY-like chemotaxis protein
MSHDPLLTLLLVEDDDVAAESVTRSLQRVGFIGNLVWAEDGAVGLAVLRGRDAVRKAPRPRLVLLDLNMPNVDGFEFLRRLRSDSVLCDEVVFVLTTSSADSDRVRAYQEHVAGYMIKSAVGAQMSRLASLLVSYRTAVQLP